MTACPLSEVSDEAELVHAAQTGDRAAFGQLYDRYARMVHGILLARVPRREVDDLVQDVFLLAMRRLPSLRDAARIGAWLATIARNRCSDFYRRSRTAHDLAGDSIDAGAGNQATASGQELSAERVLAIIRTLPEAYRETLILRLVEGMTGPEIAARTGLSPGSVRVNLHRGMGQLRDKLGHASLGCGKP